MADVVDTATRSRMMAGIRSKDTRPELFIRQRLHALGFRYRLHDRRIQGKPDLVFPKYAALIDVRGCFWHGHDCGYFKAPATNPEYWARKVMENQQRDARNFIAQTDAGWRSLIVWECAIRKAENLRKESILIQVIVRWLIGGSRFAVMDQHGMRVGPRKQEFHYSINPENQILFLE
jgi:DNA mismatch endonuclease (patch repair protein)